jgi:general secretion pathway protein L
MLAELFTWWTRQMADLTAPVRSRLRAAEPDALLLTAQPGGTGDLLVATRKNGRAETLDDIPPMADSDRLRRAVGAVSGRLPVTVVWPAPPLIRDVTLPIAAEASLDRVVRYEMDRLTPFAVEDVLFSHRVVGHDRVRGVVLIELALVPKTWVRALLDRLAQSGIVPVALEATGPDGMIRRIPIVHADPEWQARQRLIWRLALGACAVMAVAVIAVPVVRQSMALANVAARIKELRPRVDQVETLRQRIAAGSAGSGLIAAARQQAAELLTILGVLTDTLPDDTYLTSLTLRQRHLVIEGHSAAATRLIAAMAGEARLRNPSFAAPVLRSDNGGEVFTIQAEVAP